MATNYLTEFEQGKPAYPREVNSNFKYLENRIIQFEKNLTKQLEEILEQVKAIFPVGCVIAKASIKPVSGFLLLDGRAVLREEYPDLYNEIGTTFGSTDSTNFLLPDARGVVIRGWDNGRGFDIGREFGSYQEDAIQQHVHDFIAARLNSVDPKGDNNRAAGYEEKYTTQGIKNARIANETRMKNIALNYFIKY